MRLPNSEKLYVSARYRHIEARDLAEFKQLAAELVVTSRANPGTLRYDVYMNADESACVILEEYANSDACLAHINAVGTLLARLIPLGGGIELECFGNPTPVLVEACAPLSPTVFRLMTSA